MTAAFADLVVGPNSEFLAAPHFETWSTLKLFLPIYQYMFASWPNVGEGF